VALEDASPEGAAARLSATVSPGPDSGAVPARGVAAVEQLGGIQSITDAALSRLEPQALLTELVDRVKEVLGADTAAVLLLERGSDLLVATAASGLEEEIRQGVRIPVGRGFAGRVAAERRPVIIDDVSEHNVINPVLLARGIRSLIGAPLVADGEVLGVLHVGTLTSRKFTSHDTDLLQLAADRAALAVRSLSAQADRAAAAALQASLAPAALPEIAGLELAGRYVPGSGIVGGDWYDAFGLPGGQACAVIGDVAGSGLRAAVIMGRIRSALRAYALETHDPAEVIARLDGRSGTSSRTRWPRSCARSSSRGGRRSRSPARDTCRRFSRCPASPPGPSALART
jgi:sigma-B regulation protein RsbU (phosphoserine phosphatase)